MVLVVDVHAPLPAKAWPRRGSIADKASPKRLLVLRLAACGRVGLTYEARAASRSIASPGYDQSAKWPFQGGRTHCDRLNWRFRVPLAAGDWLVMHGAAPTLAPGMDQSYRAAAPGRSSQPTATNHACRSQLRSWGWVAGRVSPHASSGLKAARRPTHTLDSHTAGQEITP